MDLSDNWIQICNVLFQPPGFVLGIFGFLMVANAFAMRHSVDCIQSKKFALQNCQKPKFFSFKSLIPARWRYDNDDVDNRHAEQGEWTNFMKPCNDIQKSCLFIDLHQLKILMMFSFYVGYTSSHFVGVIFRKRHSGKWILAMTLILTVILSVTSPYVIDLYGVRGFLCLRFFMGLIQGHFLATLKIFPLERRHSGSSHEIWLANKGYIGILLINLVATIMANYMEASNAVSYSMGLCAVLWLIGYIMFLLTEPELSRNCSIEETLHSSPLLYTPFNHLSSSSENWTYWWYGPTIMGIISSVLQHESTQSLIVTEIHRRMNGFRESATCCVYNSWWKMFISLFVTLLLAFMTHVLGNIMVTFNIINATEAINLETNVASFSPKICSDFVTCIMSTETANVITICNCALGVLSTYYMGMKINSMNAENNYAGALVDVVNEMGSITTVMTPYMQIFLRKEGSMENSPSLMWLICSLFTSENTQPPCAREV